MARDVTLDVTLSLFAMGALPARLRTEPRTGSLRLIGLVALLADSVLRRMEATSL